MDPADGLVLQYEVKYSEGVTCGGAYLKFFTEDPDFDPTELTNSSPYSVMFGPDKCGATNKVGVILQSLPLSHSAGSQGLQDEPGCSSWALLQVCLAVHKHASSGDQPIGPAVRLCGLACCAVCCAGPGQANPGANS